MPIKWFAVTERLASQCIILSRPVRYEPGGGKGLDWSGCEKGIKKFGVQTTAGAFSGCAIHTTL